MKRAIVFVLTLLNLTRMVMAGDPVNPYWHQFRGPLGTGVSPLGDPPISWSETKNIRWKITIPGKGQSTPIVWKDQIFVLTAEETGEAIQKIVETNTEDRSWMRAKSPEKVVAFSILSVSRKSGQVQWRKILRRQLPVAGTHGDGSWASNSPITDGELVFAYFGSHGLYCLDMNGNLIWDDDLGDMQTRNNFGEGSSPALYEDKLIINWDHEGESFIVVFNKKSGKQIWRKIRDERTSWSTPIVVEVQGKPQLITSATNRILGYDLNTGDEIWESTGMTYNVIPTPVHGNGVAYFMSGFRGSAMQAIDLLKAKGNVKGTDALLWEYNKNTPYTPSALLYDRYLYFLERNDAILTCLNAETGELLFGTQKLEGVKGVYASPVGAQNHVYIVGRNGVTYVIEKSGTFQVLSQNILEDGFDASPVIVGKDLILRGLKHLYCISEE